MDEIEPEQSINPDPEDKVLEEVVTVEMSEEVPAIEMSEEVPDPPANPTPEIENDENLISSKQELLQQLEVMEVDLKSEEMEQSEELILEPEQETDTAEIQEAEATTAVFDEESVKLRETSYFQNNQLVELGRCVFPNSRTTQFYLKGCLFSPDGCCILTSVVNDGLHVFDLPQDLYGQEEVSESRDITPMKSVIHVKTTVNIYDYCWYPYMNSQMPETCYWISSAQNEPIKMYDAFNGNLTASYRGYDAVDELEAAYGLCFSPDGQKIIGGYKKSIKIFNTTVPGRDYDEIPLKNSISCLAMNYFKENILVAGSWNKSLAIYDMTSQEQILKIEDAHRGGLTYLKFFANGNYLLSGSRRDASLNVWDLRNVKSALTLDEFPKFQELQRRVDTNQKIYFDMSYYSWIVSGDTRGIAHIWNLSDNDEHVKEIQFPISEDCCNGVSLSPYLPIMATSTGQYHFDSDEMEIQDTISVDNSLSLWWFGRNKEIEE